MSISFDARREETGWRGLSVRPLSATESARASSDGDDMTLSVNSAVETRNGVAKPPGIQPETAPAFRTAPHAGGKRAVAGSPNGFVAADDFRECRGGQSSRELD